MKNWKMLQRLLLRMLRSFKHLERDQKLVQGKRCGNTTSKIGEGVSKLAPNNGKNCEDHLIEIIYTVLCGLANVTVNALNASATVVEWTEKNIHFVLVASYDTLLSTLKNICNMSVGSTKQTVTYVSSFINQRFTKTIKSTIQKVSYCFFIEDMNDS